MDDARYHFCMSALLRLSGLNGVELPVTPLRPPPPCHVPGLCLAAEAMTSYAWLKLSGVEDHSVPKLPHDLQMEFDFGVLFVFKFLLYLEFILICNDDYFINLQKDSTLDAAEEIIKARSRQNSDTCRVCCFY